MYNHLRRLEEEGRIAVSQQKPRTPETATRLDADRENFQRECASIWQTGALIPGYGIEKPKAVPVDVTFSGVLDAKQIRGKVSRVIAFCVEQNDEEQEVTK